MAEAMNSEAGTSTGGEVRNTLRRLFNRVSNGGQQVSTSSSNKSPSRRKEKQFSKVACLVPKVSQKHPPSTEQKLEMFDAGCSEKSVLFKLSDDADEVDAKIKKAFPMIRDAGGYVLLTSARKKLVKISCGPCTALKVKTSLGFGRLYIRPLQKDLKFSIIEDKSKRVQTCFQCNHEIALDKIESHLEEHNKDDDNSNGFESTDSKSHSDKESINLRQFSTTPSLQATSNAPRADSPSITSVDLTNSDSYREPLEDNVSESDTAEEVIDLSESDAAVGNAVDNVDAQAVAKQDINELPLLHQPIPADIEADTTNITLKVIEEVETLIGNSNEPCTIMKQYQKVFMQGRALDADIESNIDDGPTSEIFVWRSSTLASGIEDIMQITNIRYPLEVQFYRESAIDTGGPRKEFFRLACRQMVDKGILVQNATGEHLLVGSNPQYITNHGYYASGLIVGLSCIQGGDNMPLHHTVFEEADEDSLYAKQFKNGLKKCGILTLIQRHSLLKYLWTNPENHVLTVGKFLKAFKVDFSEEGSSNKWKEELTYKTFVSYVREVAGRGRPNVPSLNLRELLGHITGSSRIPVLGFSPPASIIFVNDEGLFPRIHTCVNQLVLSRLDQTVQDQQKLFKQRLDWAFSSPEFGAET